jgi:hypothetical protein
MNKTILLILFYFLTGNLSAQKSLFIDTLHQDPYFSRSEDSLVLKFDTITLSEFSRYSNKYKYSSWPDTNKNTLAKTDSSFTLETKTGVRTFFSDYRYYTRTYDYIGFYPTLNLYLINYCSATSAIQLLFLVDSNTGKHYNLESGFDNGFELPLVSPKSNFILNFANNMFEKNNSYFMILKIEKENNSYILKNYAELFTYDFEVVEAFWTNDKTFVMQTTEHPTEKQFFVRVKL